MSSTEKKPSARKRTTSSTTPRTSSTPAKVTTTIAPRVRVTRSAKSATPTKSKAASPSPTHQDIERRAYELFLRDGRTGDALQHWLQAERELRRV